MKKKDIFTVGLKTISPLIRKPSRGKLYNRKWKKNLEDFDLETILKIFGTPGREDWPDKRQTFLILSFLEWTNHCKNQTN